jgi:acyl-CoA synthetase (AMP-forming)/AMP-acid ligase II
MNITDPILFQARHDPEALAICAPGVDLVPYGRLEISINNVARRALAVGLSPGQVIAVFLPQHPVLHAVVVLGLARVGIVTTSITARKLPKSLRFDAILSDGPQPHPDIKTIQFDMNWMKGDGKPVEINHITSGDDLCRVMLTSGTTGEQKAVSLTHNMILGRVLRYHALCGNKLSFCSRMLCDVTLATGFGFTMLIYMLCKGGAFFMRGNNAENTLRALAFYRVDSLVTSPGTLPELLTEYDKHRCQHAFDAILTGGATLSTRMAERIGSRMGANIIAGYGSAEAGLVASGPSYVVREIQGAVGYVNPGMTIEIVDESDRPLPPGYSGLVRMRGDYMVDGYYNDPEASAQVFRNGWFYPGDIGSLTKDGMLIISGRQQAILNLGGEKIAPEAIEHAIASYDASFPVAAVLVATDVGVEQIWVAIESDKPIDEAKLREHCQKYLPGIFVPKRFVTVSRLPRNEMGKIDRGELRQRLRPN